jgi:aspartate carbamoyltransferase regulatory subunit
MNADKNDLYVADINNGTVIDHIPAGRGVKIITHLMPTTSKSVLTLGLNLPSKIIATKDVIKIHDKELNEDEANRVAIFAPQATISLVKDGKVAKKFKVQIPKTIQTASLRCLNPNCITNHEAMEATFQVIKMRDDVKLHCKYCEKTFNQIDIKNAWLK